ncbi:MAG: cohesin domain-containing protein [Patescibacteria group bacterium]|jgi:hypothetical protein
MRARRIFLYAFCFVILSMWSSVAAQSVSAATMQFSPSSGSYSTGTAFQVQVIVNTQGVDTTSSDAVIKYDSAILAVDSVSYGSLYPTVLHSVQNNKLYISGMVSNPGSVINSSGTLATINFKGLTASPGTISFDCTTGQTNDSNVTKNDTNATDILDCSTLASATYTFSGSTISVTPGPSATPGAATSTPTPIGTTEPVPTQLPAAGITDLVPLIPRLLMGLLFLVIGLVPLLI